MNPAKRVSQAQEAPPWWRERVLEALRRGGPTCQRAAAYIARHGTPIRFRKQPTGARWTLSGGIELNPDLFSVETDPADPRLLGAIVHEATHLEQGPAAALSVEGELHGWRAEFLARAELGAPIPDKRWETVARTPVPPTTRDLREARAGMMAVAGRRYLIWLLPLRANRLTSLLARVAARLRRRS